MILALDCLVVYVVCSDCNGGGQGSSKAHSFGSKQSSSSQVKTNIQLCLSKPSLLSK